MKILNRWTNVCIWEGEAETMRGAVSAALKSGADLRDADIRGANLSGADLRDADLSGADLRDADIRGANLSCADLSSADLSSANLSCADLSSANLSGADLSGTNLRDADLRDADLRGANLSGANLSGANLSSANLSGIKIKALRVFAGMYEYQVWAVVAEDGSPWVRMGCQFRSLAEWEKIGGIRESQVREYPNDGSVTCERRARAFEYARIEALEMAKEA